MMMNHHDSPRLPRIILVQASDESWVRQARQKRGMQLRVRRFFEEMQRSGGWNMMETWNETWVIGLGSLKPHWYPGECDVMGIYDI